MSLPIRDLPAAQYVARAEAAVVDMLVLHTSGTHTAQDAIRLLRGRDSHLSAHFLVEDDGKIWRLAPDAARTRHAGPVAWRGRTDLDDRAIGVCLVHPGGAADFGLMQLAVACDLCLEILARHPITARNVVGLADIAPQRAQSPGQTFDWEGFAANGVGLWPVGVPDLGITGIVRDADSLRDVRAALRDIGYDTAPEGALDPALSAVLRAFQRHWRPEEITGQADSGTLARLLAVARMCG